MVIANGNKQDILIKLFSGKRYGTFFVSNKEKLTSRKRWIAFNLKPQGAVIIDEGAANAILKRGKSLLPSGILRVEGEFNVGAPVEFRDNNNHILGIGLANYSASDIFKIKGLNSKKITDRLGHKPYDEVIHRDNLAITLE